MSLSYAVYKQADKELFVKVQGFVDTVNAYNATLNSNLESIPEAIQRTLYLEEAMKSNFFAWPTLKRIDLEWKDKMFDLALRYDYILILNPVGEIINRSSNAEDTLITLRHQD